MLWKPLCKIIKQHGHSGRCSQKAPAAFQPGGHGEFVHPAMKRSTTEVGNDGSTKKSTGGSSSQGVTGYERKKCGRGGGIINLNFSLVICASQKSGWGGPGSSCRTGLVLPAWGGKRALEGGLGSSKPSVLEIPLCPGPVECLECPRARAEMPQLEWIRN